jgi:benzodiazapine receptor
MDWTLFVIFLAACAAAGSTGQMFRPGPWYERLDKPGWTPPNWLFPIAWTLLYIAISVAAARVGTQVGSAFGLALWALQIALNTLWTPVFFGLRRMGAALVVLSGLWLAVAATTVIFFGFDRISGLLFAPYLVWVSYAWALNLTVWRMNPGQQAAA